MTTDNFCFYLQNRLIRVNQEVNGTVILPPLVFPGTAHAVSYERKMFMKLTTGVSAIMCSIRH